MNEQKFRLDNLPGRQEPHERAPLDEGRDAAAGQLSDAEAIDGDLRGQGEVVDADRALHGDVRLLVSLGETPLARALLPRTDSAIVRF